MKETPIRPPPLRTPARRGRPARRLPRLPRHTTTRPAGGAGARGPELANGGRRRGREPGARRQHRGPAGARAGSPGGGGGLWEGGPCEGARPGGVAVRGAGGGAGAARGPGGAPRRLQQPHPNPFRPRACGGMFSPWHGRLSYSRIHAPLPFPGNCSPSSWGAPASRPGTRTGQGPQLGPAAETRRPLCRWPLPGAAAAPCSSQEPFPFCREEHRGALRPDAVPSIAAQGCSPLPPHCRSAHHKLHAVLLLPEGTDTRRHAAGWLSHCCSGRCTISNKVWCLLQTSCHRLSTCLSAVFTSSSQHPRHPPIRAQRVSGQEKQ